MSKSFAPGEINGMILSNRFVRSATWEGMAAPEGAVTPMLTETMADLARGGIGLIISSHAYVSTNGQAGPWQLGIYQDELIPGLQGMTAEVHKHGAKIVMQLAHAGVYAFTKATGQPALVVSDYEGMSKSPVREISQQDIGELITAFADAAKRAKAAGFDGVQIHTAHGYLLSQFLSPLYNRRQDEYGGDIKNRARIHLEIYHAIRKAVGENYPILIKLNCQDFIENGLTLEESIQVGCMLAEAGIDAIELSGGVLTGKTSPSRAGINSEEKEAYHQEEARAFKGKIDIPLILVGGIRSFEVSEKLLTDGTADYISMSRPFIREPNLINRWKSGDLHKAECISDNLCFGPGRKGEGTYCVVEKIQKDKIN